MHSFSISYTWLQQCFSCSSSFWSHPKLPSNVTCCCTHERVNSERTLTFCTGLGSRVIHVFLAMGWGMAVPWSVGWAESQLWQDLLLYVGAGLCSGTLVFGKENSWGAGHLAAVTSGLPLFTLLVLLEGSLGARPIMSYQERHRKIINNCSQGPSCTPV